MCMSTPQTPTLLEPISPQPPPPPSGYPQFFGFVLYKNSFFFIISTAINNLLLKLGWHLLIRLCLNLGTLWLSGVCGWRENAAIRILTTNFTNYYYTRLFGQL